MNKADTILLLNQLGIKPNKHLGQNFLIDNNIVEKILTTAKITKNDIVLEIGSGLGALLGGLIKSAKMVYAYEVDRVLYDYLRSKFDSFSNLMISNSDILTAKLPTFNKVVSNIPYTITGAIFEKIFYVNQPPEGVLIIEKKIADRIIYPKDYKNFSRISITFNAFMEPITHYAVPSNVFYPPPKIKLTLIQVKPKVNIDAFLLDEETKQFFFKLIQGIMPYKNKNLINALIIFFKNLLNVDVSKQTIARLLSKNGINDGKFALFSTQFFLKLSRILWEFISEMKYD